MSFNRRQFLKGALAVTAAGIGAAAYEYWPEQGFRNACRGKLPDEILNSDLVKAAWNGLDANRVWDCHTHITGVGDSASGIWLNPQMSSLLHPLEYAQKFFFMDAGCVDQAGQIDSSYVTRMLELVSGMRPGFKTLLFAFEHHYTESGEIDLSRTTFHVPNRYAQQLVSAYQGSFEWAASIHPYRKDCVAALDDAVKGGARAVKWLPAAMGMDPLSAKCDKFFEAMARHDIPLISHAGMERAVHGGNAQEYGNPLRLRRALDHGVRVVVAHCASMGQDRDIDKGENGPLVDSFSLFARLMSERRYSNKVFGDISAITQVNRMEWVKPILEHSEWHSRLLNGSDYPLPGVMPLFSVQALADQKLIPATSVSMLRKIREYNPLLFDFVLKRQLNVGGKMFAASIFETRDFFLKRYNTQHKVLL